MAEAPQEPPHFPEEEEGLPGIHIDLHKHEGFSGGNPAFSGGFHGAGSGGAEIVDPHPTGLSKLERHDMDKATGYSRTPGTAGAHPVMVHGPVQTSEAGTAGGVGVGEGPTGGQTQEQAEPVQEQREGS